MNAQDLYVFETLRHADVDFPRRLRTPEQLVASAPSLKASPDQLYGRYLRNVYLYGHIDPIVRSVIQARMERAGPSRLFEVWEPKPALPRLP